LPRTPLWDRLQRDGRLIADDTGLESNVRFLRPYDEVVATWRRCIEYAYDPERLFARFLHQVDTTYVNRIATPARGKLNMNNLRRGLVLAFNVALRVGLLSDYRRSFWRAARYALRRGQIDAVLGMGFVAHHLIHFSREALRGDQNASFYSAQTRMPAKAQDGQALSALRKSA
jgi:hopanoid C-2 methylase